MRNPQKSVPIALMVVLALVSVIYISVLGVAFGTLPGIADHPNPVAAASALVMGPVGGTIIAIGIVVSVFGTNAGAALVSPRRFYAMAERGDLPKYLAKVHSETGAPVPAIILMCSQSAVLAATGSFKELAVLGVVARVAQYIPTCLAVLVLRRRGESPGFRLPLGPVGPLLTVALCVWLLVNTDPEKLWKGGVALLLGVPLYALARWNRGR
jgi:amino acid transporter